jgi:hypothetical protein
MGHARRRGRDRDARPLHNRDREGDRTWSGVHLSPLRPACGAFGKLRGVGICAADNKIVRTKGRTSQYWRLPLSQSPSTILEKAVFEAADDGAPGRSGSGTVTALRSRSPSPAPPRRKSAGGVPVPEADEAIHVGLERINACQLLEARLDIGVSVSSQMAPRDAPSVPLLTLIHRLLVARAYALRGVGPFRSGSLRYRRRHIKQRCGEKRREQDYREFHW